MLTIVLFAAGSPLPVHACPTGLQVGKIIARALKSLQSHGVVISREAWLKEAEAAERAQPACVHTCRWVAGSRFRVSGFGSSLKVVMGFGWAEVQRCQHWGNSYKSGTC